MKCKEASPGEVVEPGTIYLGKGGYHMTLFKKLTGRVVLRTPTRPEHSFIPSVDVMMESVLEVFGSDTVGVLMTGMGDDGADAMLKIRNAGGRTIAESEASAVVFGMPREAIERGGAEIIAPSWDIAREIERAIG
jgi:two-component system chemotaxis response regulator CheB